jgi:hypothetical protein
VTQTHVDLIVKNMNKMDTVSVPVYQDIKELHQIANLNVLSVLTVV